MKELTSTQVAQVVLMARELERAEPELRAFIDRMNEDAQTELVALMWVGRGVFEVEDLDEAIATASSEASTPTADYLIGTPHLSDNLEAGLEAMGYSANDAEDDVLGKGLKA